ncbi:MAG TPA: SDR family NAD(P)-dependent oxidoreductase, partial [Pyrinomonadaceae bacterium]
QTYEPLLFDNLVPGCSSFRQGGVYLITGGLGGVSITISEYLAKKYHAKIMLVGRTSLPDRESQNALLDSNDADDSVRTRIRTLERIEQLGGEVLYVSANVADLSGMRTVIQQAYQRFGALHGVFHAAGIVGDYLEVKDSNFETCDPHFQAKAHGLTVLEEVLEGRALDFCLLISSLASVLGGLGQAAYASANIFMDSFARRHNRSSRVSWLSVNWDVWRGHDRTATGSALGTTLKELGMSAEEATDVMETVLAMRNVSHLVVSTGDLSARIDQWIKLESLNNRHNRRRTVASPTKSTLAHGDKTEQRIVRIWQDALGIEEIGIHDSFTQLGGHSLLAIRIVSEMRKAFQIDLPVRALFDAPTVSELGSYVKKRITAEIEALSEEEVQRLLRMSEAECQNDLIEDHQLLPTLVK